MKPLPTATFEFEFLTPCFSGTAEGKNATFSELRVPPIRGHIRMWHITAFGATDANAIWGSTSGDGSGSRVAVALASKPGRSDKESDILPHKENERHRGSRVALPAGSRAAIVLTRLPACTGTQWENAVNATKLWLLLGTLGLRSARAAGSVWPLDDPAEPWVPKDASTLKTTLTSLGLNKHSVALIGAGNGKSASELRTTASDTVSDRTIFGGINDRAPSPTRFKIITLAGGHCLLVNAPRQTPSILQRAEDMLNRKPKPERWKALDTWNHLIP